MARFISINASADSTVSEPSPTAMRDTGLPAQVVGNDDVHLLQGRLRIIEVPGEQVVFPDVAVAMRDHVRGPSGTRVGRWFYLLQCKFPFPEPACAWNVLTGNDVADGIVWELLYEHALSVVDPS